MKNYKVTLIDREHGYILEYDNITASCDNRAAGKALRRAKKVMDFFDPDEIRVKELG